MTVAANFVADGGSIYNVKVTYTIRESSEFMDVLHGKDKVTVCIMSYTAAATTTTTTTTTTTPI